MLWTGRPRTHSFFMEMDGPDIFAIAWIGIQDPVGIDPFGSLRPESAAGDDPEPGIVAHGSWTQYIHPPFIQPCSRVGFLDHGAAGGLRILPYHRDVGVAVDEEAESPWGFEIPFCMDRGHDPSLENASEAKPY